MPTKCFGNEPVREATTDKHLQALQISLGFIKMTFSIQHKFKYLLFALQMLRKKTLQNAIRFMQ